MVQQLQLDPIQIYWPNGGTLANQMYVWDGSKPVLWDGQVTFSGTITIGAVTGNLTHNGQVPPAGEQLGVLPAIANAAAPTYTEGRQVLLSTDLSGALRVLATISTTGLATDTNQTSGAQKTQIVDGSGNVIGSTGNALQVNLKTSSITLPVSIAAAVTVQATNLDIRDLTFATDTVDVSGSAVTVSGSALPTGAATLAEQQLQTALQASLGVVGNGTATGALRVTLANNSTGVIATVSTVTAVTSITNPVTVAQATAANLNATVVGTGTFVVQATLSAGSAVIGHVITDTGSTTAVTGNVTVVQATGTNLHAVIDSGTITTVTAVTAITNALPAGNNNIGDVDVATIPGIVGTVADDATTPGAPVMTGGFAKNPDGTDPGSVSAEDDVVRWIGDRNRRQYVNTVHPRFGHVHLDGSSAYTDQSLVADPGDGFQTIITNIIGSTGAATALNFFLEEGSTKIFGPIYLEAVAGRGFASGPIFLPVTASTAVTLTSSVAIAQSFDVDYFIQAVP